MVNPSAPEYHLSAAIVRQAWLDLRSPDRAVRHEAQAFWQSPAVGFWCEVLGLDEDVVRRHVTAALTTTSTREIAYEQLALF